MEKVTMWGIREAIINNGDTDLYDKASLINTKTGSEEEINVIKRIAEKWAQNILEVNKEEYTKQTEQELKDFIIYGK